MPRSLLLLAGSLFCLVAAAPLRAESSDEPHYLIQVQPAGRLLKTVQEFARKFAAPQLGDKAAEQSRAEIENYLNSTLGKGWRDALDEDRMILIYGRVGQTPEESMPVVMLPVKSAKAAREHLQTMGAKLEDSKEGCQKCVLPNQKDPVHIRFANGYLYASLTGPEPLADARRLAPLQLIDPKEKSAVVARVHLDRLPKAFKDKMVKDFNGGVQQGMHGSTKELSKPVEQALERWQKKTEGWVSAIARYGKELSVRMDLDAATGEFKTSLQLTPVQGSELAMLLAAVRRGPSLGAALVSGSPLGAVHARLSLPEDVSDFLLTQVRQGIKQAAEQVEDDKAREAYSNLGKTLEPTIKDGVLDSALVLHGPGKNNRYGTVLSLQLRDGLAIEKAAKKLVGLLPAKNPLGLMRFDTDTIEGVKVHRYPLGEMLPEPVQKLFGKAPVVIAFRKDGVLLAYGDKADEHLGKALTAELGKAPPLVLRAEGDTKGLADLIVRSDPGPESAEQVKKFADLFESRVSLLDLAVIGGDSLQVRASINLLLMPRAAAKPPAKKPSER